LSVDSHLLQLTAHTLTTIVTGAKHQVLAPEGTSQYKKKPNRIKVENLNPKFAFNNLFKKKSSIPACNGKGQGTCMLEVAAAVFFS
jgi:hypothetical protein